MKRTGLMLATIATLFFATSPIFTRTASELSPTQVAFFRMFGGSLFIAAISKVTGHSLSINQFHKKYLIYGLITAGHFLFYIWSLYYTSIAHTVVIVYTAPVYIYLFEISRGYKLSLKEISGIFVTLIGLALLLGIQADFSISNKAALGNLMAFISALCLAVYSLFGRKERHNETLFTYTFWLYLMSSIILLPFAVLDWQTSFGSREILSVLGLALFPTALGHTFYNAALRKIRSFYPSMIATQEVTGGIVLGIIFLDEIPTVNTFLGTIISLAGIIMIIYHSHNINKD